MPDLLGNSRYFLQISNAYYRVCFIGGNMLVSVFFFIKIYEACPLLNTPLLQLPSRISRIGVNKRVFSPLLALVSLLRQGVVTSCILKSRGGNIPTRSRTSKSSRWKASSNGNILGDTFCRGDHFINQASNHNRFHHLSQGAVEGDWSWVPLNVGGFLRHSRERRVSGCITVWEFEFVTDFLIDPPEGVSQKEIVRFVFVHVILCRKTMTILSCPSKSS